MDEDRRKFSRIDTYLRAWVRILPSATSPAAYTDYAVQPTAMPGRTLHGSKLPDPVISYLEEMDKKLDMILSLLSQEHLQDHFPIKARVTNLGGAGLKFTSKEPFELGQYLEMVVIINRVPLRLAGAIGKIIRQEEAPQLGPVWALDFTRIREQDLEAVVHFVFNAERQHIREQRWES